MNPVISHYDSLVDENNDPFRDPPALKTYMDKWDGQMFIDSLTLDRTKTVLEIGIGTGRLAARTAPLCKRLVGIDISPKTIIRAKENLCEYHNVFFVSGNFYEYQFDMKFDVIYSSLTFLHFQDKPKAIAIIMNLLNENGKIVLALEKNQAPFIEYNERKIKIYPDNPSEIKRILENNHFRNISQFETEFSYVISALK